MRLKRMLLAVMFDLVAMGGAMAATPLIGPAPASYAFDGAVNEWAAREAAFSLIPMQPGGRSGRVWLGHYKEGLIVGGAVDGPSPRFASDPGQMASGDHVEVWLATVEQPTMPPIGWGHQFGPQELRSAADCANDDHFGEDPEAVAACKKWYVAQLRYRKGIARLFARQWQLSPSVAVETWAKPAFDAMSEEEREAAAPLAPAGSPLAAFALGTSPGYTFEIRVPWEAMPAANDLALRRLRFMVDVFSPGTGDKYGPFSTTSEQRKYGRLDTLNAVSIDLVSCLRNS